MRCKLGRAEVQCQRNAGSNIHEPRAGWALGVWAAGTHGLRRPDGALLPPEGWCRPGRPRGVVGRRPPLAGAGPASWCCVLRLSEVPGAFPQAALRDLCRLSSARPGFAGDAGVRSVMHRCVRHKPQGTFSPSVCHADAMGSGRVAPEAGCFPHSRSLLRASLKGDDGLLGHPACECE